MRDFNTILDPHSCKRNRLGDPKVPIHLELQAWNLGQFLPLPPRWAARVHAAVVTQPVSIWGEIEDLLKNTLSVLGHQHVTLLASACPTGHTFHHGPRINGAMNYELQHLKT